MDTLPKLYKACDLCGSKKGDGAGTVLASVPFAALDARVIHAHWRCFWNWYEMTRARKVVIISPRLDNVNPMQYAFIRGKMGEYPELGWKHPSNARVLYGGDTTMEGEGTDHE